MKFSKIEKVFSFGKSSQAKLASCHVNLQKIAVMSLEKSQIDISIISGQRNKLEQNELFGRGLSKLRFPESKHNTSPSNAYDFAPYVKGKLVFPASKGNNYIQEMGYYYYIAGIMQSVAKDLDIKVRWGGNWDSDGDFTDQTFHDLGHIEL